MLKSVYLAQINIVEDKLKVDAGYWVDYYEL